MVIVTPLLAVAVTMYLEMDMRSWRDDIHSGYPNERSGATRYDATAAGTSFRVVALFTARRSLFRLTCSHNVPGSCWEATCRMPLSARPWRIERFRRARRRKSWIVTRSRLHAAGKPLENRGVESAHRRVPMTTTDLDRLGDEIADLSAHLDAATAHLLELIREFDAREGWNTGL
jgi:hypothetical protein